MIPAIYNVFRLNTLHTQVKKIVSQFGRNWSMARHEATGGDRLGISWSLRADNNKLTQLLNLSGLSAK